MYIERVRQVDSSESNESGLYDYYYEYDTYRFTEGTVCFVVRSYTDEPDEAHFLRVEESGNRRALTSGDLSHPLFHMAHDHLRGEGKVRIRWLSGKGNGYESL